MSQADLVSAMLEARLALVDKIRRVGYRLARDEHAKAAAALIRVRTHALGNQVQIMRLASLEIERRLGATADKHHPGRLMPDEAELVADLRLAADEANAVLSDLLTAAQPAERPSGPPVAPIVLAAIDAARPAVSATIDVTADLPPTSLSKSVADELEACMFAAILDAAQATRIAFTLRARMIERKPWIEIIRICDRRGIDLGQPFEPFSLLHFVEHVALAAGGEATLSHGRTGLELSIALPVALPA